MRRRAWPALRRRRLAPHPDGFAAGQYAIGRAGGTFRGYDARGQRGWAAGVAERRRSAGPGGKLRRHSARQPDNHQ